jgi:hypothetical protein
MWSNIRTGLGPARPNKGTTWFRAGLGHCFYTSGWHGTAQKMFELSWPEPVWHEARWLGPGWPGPAQFPALVRAKRARHGSRICSSEPVRLSAPRSFYSKFLL